MNENQKVVMYKLVTQDWTTHGGMKWEIGKTNCAIVAGNKMCSEQVLHCYNDPYLAVIFNPIHANIYNPILLEIECSEIINSDGLKFACKEQMPVKQIELPNLTLRQKVMFAIKCALLVYKATDFVAWAEKWISGEDTSARAARAAYAAARADAAYDAAYAAYAAYAARAAAYHAARAAAYHAAYTAARAADAAAYAAAAYAAARAAIDFKQIIQWVLEQN